MFQIGWKYFKYTFVLYYFSISSLNILPCEVKRSQQHQQDQKESLGCSQNSETSIMQQQEISRIVKRFFGGVQDWK